MERQGVNLTADSTSADRSQNAPCFLAERIRKSGRSIDLHRGRCPPNPIAGMIRRPSDLRESTSVLTAVHQMCRRQLCDIHRSGCKRRHQSPSGQHRDRCARSVSDTVEAARPNRFTSHSPWKPGRRVWPVRSCCIAACLRSRFLAMSWSSAPSSASTSLNAVAMARCSGGGIGERSRPPRSSAAVLSHRLSLALV